MTYGVNCHRPHEQHRGPSLSKKRVFAFVFRGPAMHDTFCIDHTRYLLYQHSVSAYCADFLDVSSLKLAPTHIAWASGSFWGGGWIGGGVVVYSQHAAVLDVIGTAKYRARDLSDDLAAGLNAICRSQVSQTRLTETLIQAIEDETYDSELEAKEYDETSISHHRQVAADLKG